MLPLERPLPSAAGSLEKRPLAHLLIYASDRGLTGTMEITSPSGVGSFVLVAGQPHKVGFANHANPAGTDAEALARMDKLFELPGESTFAYYDGLDVLPYETSHPMEALALVWRGMKRMPPWEHVHTALNRIGTAVLSLTAPAAAEVLVRFSLEGDERRLVERIAASPCTVQDLVATEILPAGRAQLLAYCLFVTKRVEVSVTATPQPLGPVTSVGVASAPAAPAPEPAAPGTLPPVPLGPTSLFSPPTGAVFVPARVPSFAAPAAAASHPAPTSASGAVPAPPSSAVVPPPAPSSTTVARLRLRSQTRPGFTEEKPHVSSTDRRRSITPPPVTSVGDEAAQAAHAARREEIVARAKTIDTEDYFKMLGLERQATTPQVQTAFFALAKTWHPDRLPGALSDVKEACSRVFTRISEAHQTLSDNDRRTRYMRLLTDGGATPKDQETIAAVLEAATCFQKAEIFLKRGDTVQAEALCARATNLDPQQADYHALLAWIEAMKPENQTPAATRDRIERLGSAIALKGNCERAYFYRGMLYKRINDDVHAVRDFRTASELNPRNVDAQREVRLYTMRGGGNAGKPKKKTSSDLNDGETPKPSRAGDRDGPKGSFLKRLFKK